MVRLEKYSLSRNFGGLGLGFIVQGLGFGV